MRETCPCHQPAMNHEFDADLVCRKCPTTHAQHCELRRECVPLRAIGIEARRGRQFSGSPDSPDVVSAIPGVQLEAGIRRAIATAGHQVEERGAFA